MLNEHLIRVWNYYGYIHLLFELAHRSVWKPSIMVVKAMRIFTAWAESIYDILRFQGTIPVITGNVIVGVGC